MLRRRLSNEQDKGHTFTIVDGVCVHSGQEFCWKLEAVTAEQIRIKIMLLMRRC